MEQPSSLIYEPMAPYFFAHGVLRNFVVKSVRRFVMHAAAFQQADGDVNYKGGWARAGIIG